MVYNPTLSPLWQVKQLTGLIFLECGISPASKPSWQFTQSNSAWGVVDNVFSSTHSETVFPFLSIVNVLSLWQAKQSSFVCENTDDDKFNDAPIQSRMKLINLKFE